MKIYLDNCCYNRPFDDQSDIVMDAAHIACAIEKRADYFITTDRKILNKQIEGISIASPTTFVQEFFI